MVSWDHNFIINLDFVLVFVFVLSEKFIVYLSLSVYLYSIMVSCLSLSLFENFFRSNGGGQLPSEIGRRHLMAVAGQGGGDESGTCFICITLLQIV